MIEVHPGTPVIASNDNGADNASAAGNATVGARLGARRPGRSDTKSSARQLTLQPGVYSFVASGQSPTFGTILVEIYAAD